VSEGQSLQVLRAVDVSNLSCRRHKRGKKKIAITTFQEAEAEDFDACANSSANRTQLIHEILD
jgi:hypothetical protein